MMDRHIKAPLNDDEVKMAYWKDIIRLVQYLRMQMKNWLRQRKNCQRLKNLGMT